MNPSNSLERLAALARNEPHAALCFKARTICKNVCVTLAQIAVEFCHVCLCWQDAEIECGSSVVVSGVGKARLNFSDLSAVLDAAGEWCDRREVSMYLEFIALARGYYLTWRWTRGEGIGDIVYGCESVTDLPDYIMQGCLVAEGRLRCKPEPGGLRRWKADRITRKYRN